MSNTVSIATGCFVNAVIQEDGNLGAWNSDGTGFAQPFVGTSNMIAIAAGHVRILALAGNQRPRLESLDVLAGRGVDCVIGLAGSDPENDPLVWRLKSLPARGVLYQYEAGQRGPSITDPETLVSDPQGRIIFALSGDDSEMLELEFQVVANDGLYDSDPAIVRLEVDGPLHAFTQPAISITGTSAVLRASINPRGTAATAWFEWGVDASFGNVTYITNVAGGNHIRWIRLPLSGLRADQIYHCRLVATNLHGMVVGAEQIVGLGQHVWSMSYGPLPHVRVPSGISNISAIASTYMHDVALRSDGTVLAWGANDLGQTDVPEDLEQVIGVGAGSGHSVALGLDGRLTGWGEYAYAQLDFPENLTNVAAMAISTLFSIAVQDNGVIGVWGRSYDHPVEPIPSGLSNVVAVAAGDSHFLALRSDGTVEAWWSYFGTDHGQTSVPAGLSNVVAIAAGRFHNLALKQDGQLVAWGRNSSGQTNVPPGLNGIVAISAGGIQSLALRSDATIVAWGGDPWGHPPLISELTNVVMMSASHGRNLVLTLDKPVLPQVETRAPILVGATRAHLQGAVTPNGYPTLAWLEWGRTAEYGFKTSATNVANGDAPILLVELIPNLLPGATYHYRCLASNVVEVVNGQDVVFTTAAWPFFMRNYGFDEERHFGIEQEGSPGASYRVWMSSNLFNWILLGPMEETASGTFEFRDVGAETNTPRFYKISSP